MHVTSKTLNLQFGVGVGGIIVGGGMSWGCPTNYRSELTYKKKSWYKFVLFSMDYQIW